MSFYCSTQMARSQSMVFHGDEGFIEVTAPFNAGDYGHATITLHKPRPRTRHRYLPLRRRAASTGSRPKPLSARCGGSDDEVFTLEQSVLNQKFIDAVYRAARHDGWETV
jgi:predicted dehydrogenase